MRTMSVVCDVCKGPVEKFNGAVTMAAWGSLHKDACSPKCMCALLRGFAAEIEKKEGLNEADNVTFATQHLEATKIAASPQVESQGPIPVGCAACDTGVPVNTENAFRHTGEGKLCKAVKGPGPCACAPANWRMALADSSATGPREVVCDACGSVWEAAIHETAPLGKRRGRPPGSGKKQPVTNGNGHETPENKAERDKQLGRNFNDTSDELERLKANGGAGAQSQPPRWCSCGIPLVFSKPNGDKDLGKWSCEAGHELVQMGVKEGLPGENLSQLLTDVEKLGTKLSLVDVAAWPVIKRDMLRAWIARPEDGAPAFLTPEPEPEPEPKQKYTF